MHQVQVWPEGNWAEPRMKVSIHSAPLSDKARLPQTLSSDPRLPKSQTSGSPQTTPHLPGALGVRPCLEKEGMGARHGGAQHRTPTWPGTTQPNTPAP